MFSSSFYSKKTTNFIMNVWIRLNNIYFLSLISTISNFYFSLFLSSVYIFFTRSHINYIFSHQFIFFNPSHIMIFFIVPSIFYSICMLFIYILFYFYLSLVLQSCSFFLSVPIKRQHKSIYITKVSFQFHPQTNLFSLSIRLNFLCFPIRSRLMFPRVTKQSQGRSICLNRISAIRKDLIK